MSARKTAFSTFESRFSITFSGSLPDSHCGHTSYYRNIAPHPRESPQSSTRRRSGGGRRWSTCIKRWNVATLSPRRRGDTARPTQGDRRKPRERRRSPRRRRVGGAGKPQSSTRIRSGGGRRWSTCIKRWNVATLSPRRRGDTARPIQGDRRKPRERRRSPKSRRVGGAGKPSVLHPKAQRRRQAVEHVHQAVERRHALPKTEDAGGAAYEHATRRIGGSVAGVDQNPLASRHLHQARQSRPPGRRPSTGRAGKAWRNHVEAERIFARGNGRMRPRSGRFERGHGRLSTLGGKKQHPLRTPGQVGGAAQTNQCRHLEKIDVVNEIRAPLAAPVTNIEGMPPPKSLPHNRKPRGTARARKSDRVTLRRPSGTARHAPRSPHRTTANRAARRERRRKPRGTRRRRDEASCVVPPLASGYLPLARCRLTRRNSRSAVCALRFARAA